MAKKPQKFKTIKVHEEVYKSIKRKADIRDLSMNEVVRLMDNHTCK